MHGTGYNPNPVKCSRQCGNISVPFPFGLEEGCSARRLFQLNCSDPAHSILQYNDLLRVTYIDVGEGFVHIHFNSSFEKMEFDMLLKMMISFKEPDLFADPLESAYVPWAVANLTCQLAKQNASGYACVSANSICTSVVSSSQGYVGYRCKCSPGFEGNPYIEEGCIGNLSLPVIFSFVLRHSMLHFHYAHRLRSFLPAHGRKLGSMYSKGKDRVGSKKGQRQGVLCDILGMPHHHLEELLRSSDLGWHM